MKGKCFYLYLFFYGWLAVCLCYFALNKQNIINTVTCFFLSYIQWAFSRWRCFSFYWFGKQEFGKFTNGIPVIGGPARPPPPSHLPLQNSWGNLFIIIYCASLLSIFIWSSFSFFRNYLFQWICLYYYYIYHYYHYYQLF